MLFRLKKKKVPALAEGGMRVGKTIRPAVESTSGEDIGDFPGLGGSEPGTFVLPEETLDSGVGLERDDEVAENNKRGNPQVIPLLGFFQEHANGIHEREGKKVG